VVKAQTSAELQVAVVVRLSLQLQTPRSWLLAVVVVQPVQATENLALLQTAVDTVIAAAQTVAQMEMEAVMPLLAAKVLVAVEVSSATVVLLRATAINADLLS
jgi:hypothetical protein